MAMQGVVRPQTQAFDWQRLLQSRWLWCIGIVAFILVREVAQDFMSLLKSQGDTDDAVRLYQVRRLMETGAWFDMSLPRLGGATPLISHWSRLVDLPLAILLSVFGLFLSPQGAELAVRLLWPMLVLLALLRLMVKAAEAQGAPAASWLVLVFATTCMSGLTQFKIGRIDHHNMMILGSMAGMLTLLEARKRPEAGSLAGILIGLGLAVGYEPLLEVIPALACLALWALWDTSWLEGVRRMAVAAAATMAAVFVATVAPSDWFVARCDALSLNMVLLFACGAAGLDIVARNGRRWTFSRRLTVLAAAGVMGVATYAAMDQRCLAGPFGQVAPELHKVWLDHVRETSSLFGLWKTTPGAVVAFAALMIAGIGAAAERWRRLKTQETAALLGLMLLTAPGGFWMLKLLPYASWIAVFAIALSVADLKATVQLTALSRQLMAALLLNQWCFMAATTGVLTVLAHPSVANNKTEATEHTRCLTTPVMKTLQTLPKGRFVAQVDFGAYLVALTPHDALAAPYHRIDQAILEADRILNAEPAEAQRRLKAAGADYVSVCAADPKADAGADNLPKGKGLEARLARGENVAFLERMPLDKAAGDLKVWRVQK